MNKIYLFALLVAVASANFAADVSNLNPYVSRYVLQCLQNHSVTRIMMEISNEFGVIHKDFLKGYIYAQDSGISSIDAMVMVNDTFDASSRSANITKALPISFNGTVWLHIVNAPQLWARNVSERISYLESLVLAFKQNNVTAGVYSDAKTWANIFGSQHAGSDTLKAAPLWYANDNNVQSFDDFSYAGFGTWTQPSLKNYKNFPQTVCGTPVSSLDYYPGEETIIHQ